MDNKSRYIEFCDNNDDIPIFHSPWWLDIVSDNWDVALSFDRSGNIMAAMPFSHSYKLGLSVSLQPQLTPYLGAILFYPKDIQTRTSIYSFENKHLNALISCLPSGKLYQYIHFLPQIDNWYPFYLNGFQQSTRYTYVLNDIKNHDKIWSGFTNTLRRQIKSVDESLKVTEENNICTVFSLVKKSFERQNVKFSVTRAMLKKMEVELERHKQGQVLVARDKSGELYSAVLLVWDSRKCYLLGLGTEPEYANSNSTKLLIWEAIKFASQHVDIFDFEGSMLPGVERLYRSFGGIRAPYFEIKKYKNRFVKSLFAIINR